MTRKLLILLFILSATTAQIRLKPINRIYNSIFPLTENPISQGSTWLNGATDGLDWKDIRTNGTIAFGTQSGSTGPPYDDSTGTLKGLWGSNQLVECDVTTTNQLTDPNYEEIEIRLRTTITAHSITGYEINWRVNHDGTQYHQIGQWYGPIGTVMCGLGCAFDPVPGSIDMRAIDGFAGVFNGDTVGAMIVANTFTTWIVHNGTKQILQSFTDTSVSGHTLYQNGNPGMGHWFHIVSGGVTSDYGCNKLSIRQLP